VHVIGPQLGLTQPGMFVVCGDSHTSTHSASVRARLSTSSQRKRCRCRPSRQWPSRCRVFPLRT
jgi:hypothetical protein